jgi:PAS domain S-box-containing protein
MDLPSQLETIGAAFESSPDPVVVIGDGGSVLYANQAAQPLCTAGTEISLACEFGKAFGAVQQLGRAKRFEWGESSLAGVRSWYASVASPLHEGDRIAAWLVTSTEVTDLKRSEERLLRAEKLMVDTQGVAHLGTWEWDVSEPHAFWSAELYRIYGLTPGTYTPSYEAYLTMVHPDDRQRVVEATNRVFHEHIPYSHDERIFRPDGSMRYLHTWAHPILGEDGALRRLVGVCQDITERKEAEEQVRRMNVELESRVAERTQQLETSMRDLESFNAMISHDLRSPLNVIELSATAISRVDAVPPDVTGRIERIRRAVSQMTSLVDDILAFASIRDAPLNSAAIDLSDMAHDIVTDLRQSSQERAVQVEIEAGISCFADPILMRRALQNILGNAWKYTSRVPAPFIGVSTMTVDGQRVLVVRDNGAGFDMKDAHHLFVPFKRLHADGEFSGTGMGLASVQRILARHGARIWAEGAPGQGATFYLELPRSQPGADCGARA